jgi:hypothetical protein
MDGQLLMNKTVANEEEEDKEELLNFDQSHINDTY